MKQVLIIITALCLALSLAACSENGQTSTYREDNYTDLRPQIDVTASNTSSNAAPMLADGTKCEYNTFYEFVAEKDADYSFVLIKDSDSALENAGVAQLVEQLICNQQVGGSSPSTSSIF